MNPTPNIYDIIIIGGGLSGLRALDLLNNDKKNDNDSDESDHKSNSRKYLLLEARDRVGGRTNSVLYNNYQWDVGGQWVGPTQSRVLKLIKESNLSTFPQQQIGRKVLEYKGQFIRYLGTVPNVNLLGSIETQIAIWRLEYLCSSIDSNQPWNHINAKKWDSISVQDWIDSNIYTDFSKALIHVSILAVFSCEPSELSFLFALSYFKMAGGVMMTLDVKGGAQQDRIMGGSQQLSNYLYEKNKSDIMLKHPIEIIKNYNNNIENEFIEIITKDGKKFNCRKLIMTLPVPLIKTIEFQPELPDPKKSLISQMSMGQVIKFIMFYQECFWRKAGFAGEIISDRKSISLIYDGSFQDGSKPSLIGFFEGDQAKEWSKKSQEQRKKEVIEILYQSFNQDERVFSPTNYIECNWMDEKYTQGGYGAYCNKNIYSKYGSSLREPVQNLHFSGTETASQWPGYMEGALESSERVVNEILNQDLKTTPKPSTPKTTYQNIYIIILSLFLMILSYFIIVYINNLNTEEN